MKQKPKTVKMLLFAIAALLLTFLAIKIAKVNHAFPQSKKILVPEGQAYVQNDVSYSVEGMTMQTLEEFFEGNSHEKIRESDYTTIAPPQDAYLSIVSMTFKNRSDSAVEIPLYSFSLTDRVWHNGIDVEMFKALNPEQGLVVDLDAREEATVVLPYVLYKPQFTEKRWNRVLDEKYFLSVAVYPQQIDFEIQSYASLPR